MQMDDRLIKHQLGFWEIADKPTAQDLQKYYAEKYYQEGTGSYELIYSQDELSYFQAKLEQRYAVIKPYLSLTQPVRLLDVGCGEGFTLAFFLKLGWNVKGIDFSSAGIASQNPDLIDALVTGDLFSLLKSEIHADKTYHVVWLQNVLEHVLDPFELLRSLRSLVSSDGVAVVTVPNDFSITQRAALNYGHIDDSFWVATPDHMTYFDHESLANIANATGWQCVEMLGDFPIDWFLFHSGSNYVRNRSLGKAAHYARVQIENLIHNEPIEDVVRFWSAAAKIGIGRDITAVSLVSGYKSNKFNWLEI